MSAGVLAFEAPQIESKIPHLKRALKLSHNLGHKRKAGDPTAPPSIEQLLSRVHPEDRSRVEEQYVRSSRSDPVYYRRPSARGLAATAGSPIPFRCAAATRRRSRSETRRAAQPPAFRRHG